MRRKQQEGAHSTDLSFNVKKYFSTSYSCCCFALRRKQQEGAHSTDLSFNVKKYFQLLVLPLFRFASQATRRCELYRATHEGQGFFTVFLQKKTSSFYNNGLRIYKIEIPTILSMFTVQFPLSMLSRFCCLSALLLNERISANSKNVAGIVMINGWRARQRKHWRLLDQKR